jgi:integral membrane protein
MNPVRSLRLVSAIEGFSFLALLFIAMPLKHAFDLPGAVRVIGPIHGFLFLGFVAALFRAHLEHDWTLGRSLRYFGLSLVPFGFVPIERALRRA